MVTDRLPRSESLRAEFSRSDRLNALKVPDDDRLLSPAKSIKDAMNLDQRAASMGFSNTVSLVHDNNGQLRSLDRETRTVYRMIKYQSRSSFPLLMRFKDDLVEGRPKQWRCRAGARYLYVCEDGLVHYCSQQRGFPGKPVLRYTRADIDREFAREKPCAPMSALSCVQIVAQLDNWRAPQSLVSVAGLEKTDPP